MPINKYYINKWLKMFSGNSILYVNQDPGKHYQINKVAGYYNNLTEKVVKNNSSDILPLTELPSGEKIEFSIAIFQYGLGAYDLYIETKNEKYKKIFNKCVKWAIDNQDKNGGWATFRNKKNKYSSMAQGEAASLLIRAYISTNDKKYIKRAHKSIDLLLKNQDCGGCSEYSTNKLFLKEYPNEPTVLNGWIFSIFGLYDYLLIDKDEYINESYKRTIRTLIDTMPEFDAGYWSKYDSRNKIASPFYHKLHISLLEVLYIITKESTLNIYKKRFIEYQNKRLNRNKALIIKGIQKIKEKND